MKKNKSKKNSNAGPMAFWRIINEDGDPLLMVYCGPKFRIASPNIDEVHHWLLEFVKPNDKITYVGFKEDNIVIKGERFLEVINA